VPGACVAAAVLLALTVTPRSASHAATSDFELACHWAPVHYQDTDSTDHDGDYLTALDYDGEGARSTIGRTRTTRSGG
jgi:hypothetical protein